MGFCHFTTLFLFDIIHLKEIDGRRNMSEFNRFGYSYPQNKILQKASGKALTAIFTVKAFVPLFFCRQLKISRLKTGQW